MKRHSSFLDPKAEGDEGKLPNFSFLQSELDKGREEQVYL